MLKGPSCCIFYLSSLWSLLSSVGGKYPAKCNSFILCKKICKKVVYWWSCDVSGNAGGSVLARSSLSCMPPLSRSSWWSLIASRVYAINLCLNVIENCRGKVWLKAKAVGEEKKKTRARLPRQGVEGSLAMPIRLK